MSSDPDAVSVLDRMTAILEAFDENDRGLRISELATRAGLPKSTVSRLVSTLVRERYLEREGQVIHLGLRLFELGQLAQEPRELRGIALPVIADLRDTTGGTVSLAIPDGGEMVCIAMMHGSRSAGLTRIGGRVPAHATALGKTMLAFSDDVDVENLLSSALPARTPHTVVDPACLRRQLADIRQRGVATEVGEFVTAVSSVASPVFAPSGSLLAAICVSGPSDGFDLDRSAPAVQAAALALTRRIASAGMTPV
jgi:IclR family transcriptional regulator, acetate operon repressor